MIFESLPGAQSHVGAWGMLILPLPCTTHPAAVFVEIVDGNAKMTLGMIWTIILRFAIQDISVEGKDMVQVKALSKRRLHVKSLNLVF